MAVLFRRPEVLEIAFGTYTHFGTGHGEWRRGYHRHACLVYCLACICAHFLPSLSPARPWSRRLLSLVSSFCPEL